MMNRSLRPMLAALLLAAACSSSNTVTPPIVVPPVVAPPKLDPFITIRVRDLLDTTTAPGRTGWTLYTLLSGPTARLNGISISGNIGLADLRLNHGTVCGGASADSIGQRLIEPLAIGDTIHQAPLPNSATDSIVARWYAGNHAAPPTGIMILTIAPIDAWDSQQFIAGHGLTPADPIKWAWDWTDSGTTTFTERAASDTTACNGR